MEMVRRASVFFIVGMIAVTSTCAHAHEKRMVEKKFEFTVGFAEEPAFAGQMNGVDLRVAEGGKPVEGLEKTLEVRVQRDDAKTALGLKFHPKWKDAGHYTGHFLPTRPGKYVFYITGEINGTAIYEKFESGGKFHDVEDSEPLRFPQL